MRKDEFLKLLAKQAEISYDEAVLFYEKLLDRFAKALKSGQAIKISGFGEFKRKLNKARKIVDPKTGMEKNIPAKFVVKFSPAKILAEKVNIKYKTLRPVVTRLNPPVTETKSENEFNLTFFEAGERQPIVMGFVDETLLAQETSPTEQKKPIEVFEVERSITERNLSATAEDYFVLPDVSFGEEIDSKVDVEVPVFEVFEAERKPEDEFLKFEFSSLSDINELKINFEEVEMPEFNLSEEPQEKRTEGVKKLFDDTQQKKEEKEMSFNYEEESRRGAGHWILIFVIFLIFVGGVIFLLNQYGYIHLWGEKKKVSKVEFKEPEEVVVTTPSLPKVEGKASVDTFEVKRPELVSKPKAPEIVKPSVGKNYVIQVASFQDRKLAETFASNLRKKGYNAFVEKAFVEWKGGNWYRVRVGFFDSIEQAKKTAEKLKRTEKVEKVWVSEAPRTVTK